jgi:hypothetical protein
MITTQITNQNSESESEFRIRIRIKIQNQNHNLILDFMDSLKWNTGSDQKYSSEPHTKWYILYRWYIPYKLYMRIITMGYEYLLHYCVFKFL